MAGNGGTTVIFGIAPPRVIRALADENAAVIH